MEPTLVDSFLGEFRALHVCGLSEAGSVSMSSPNFNQSSSVVRNLDSPTQNEPLFSFLKLFRAWLLTPDTSISPGFRIFFSFSAESSLWNLGFL